MKMKIVLCVVILICSIMSGCGKDSGNTSGLQPSNYKFDPKVYTLPTEQEAAEYFDFFTKAISAEDYGKIDETIDPAALFFFMNNGATPKEMLDTSKKESEKGIRTIKSCSSKPEYVLRKEGVVGFSVELTLKNGKKTHPTLFMLYKNGKGKTGIVQVNIYNIK